MRRINLIIVMECSQSLGTIFPKFGKIKILIIFGLEYRSLYVKMLLIMAKSNVHYKNHM